MFSVHFGMENERRESTESNSRKKNVTQNRYRIHAIILCKAHDIWKKKQNKKKTSEQNAKSVAMVERGLFPQIAHKRYIFIIFYHFQDKAINIDLLYESNKCNESKESCARLSRHFSFCLKLAMHLQIENKNINYCGHLAFLLYFNAFSFKLNQTETLFAVIYDRF